ncbi:MAG: amino acid ABC transporter permease [Rickettsiales bacterium]|jgi:polar amino acid transport system permease protein|nr:amino acid ABC transporter permease [Rickettsiales bacterium]
MDTELMLKSIPFLIKGTIMTLKLSAVSVLVGSILGLFAGLARVSKYKILNWIAVGYSDFFRGTPLIVQLFIIYFAIPSILHLNIEPFAACIIACGLNSGAYISEIVKGGIQSIDIGQTEAGKSLGLNNFQVMFYIIFPQAIKRILPAMGNEFIGLLKGTSIVSVIGMRELTREGQLIIARTYASFEIWLMVAIFYLILVVSLSRLITFAERRLND